MVPELEDPALKEVVHAPFRVVYRYSEGKVEILAAVRAEQDFDFLSIQARSRAMRPGGGSKP